jgi:phosphopentomutase
MREFERRIGRSALGNKAASGTEIIKELGAEHMRTGSPIVYTSADSVFQVAAHEDVIPLWELYKICETARQILRGPHEVGRVIARPFTSAAGAYTRTPNRKDYAVPPPRGMLLDRLEERDIPVCAVGKIFDVFGGRGIGDHVHTKNNADGMQQTLAAMQSVASGLIFVNLVDFDQLYGHRNDVEGYARALEEFDAWLPGFLAQLTPGDLALITADRAAIPPRPQPIIAANTCRYWPPDPPRARGREPRLTVDAFGLRPNRGRNFATQIEHGTSFLHDIYETTHHRGQLENVQNPARNYQLSSEKFRGLVAGVKHCDILICPPFLDVPTHRAAEDTPHPHRRAESLLDQGRRVYRRSFRAHDSRRRLHARAHRPQRAPPVFR